MVPPALHILTATSVLVHWSSLPLLPGITIKGHVIRYHELPFGRETSLVVNSSENTLEVNGLAEGVAYSFVVMATLSEEGGRELTIGACAESEVYFPGEYVCMHVHVHMCVHIYIAGLG